jgi:Zinc carboxypeptidase
VFLQAPCADGAERRRRSTQHEEWFVAPFRRGRFKSGAFDLRGHIALRSIPELNDLDRLATALGSRASLRTLCNVTWEDTELPIRVLSLGSGNASAPVIACVGGVHGLERIGAQVVLGFIETLVSAVRWDRAVSDILDQVKVLFLPVLNPVGVMIRRRSNGRGVDLMRNAPVDADRSGLPLELYRGHRLSRRLPWFRGDADEREPEAAALCDWVRAEASGSPFVITLDVHSGFVGADRIWFPYARTRSLFPHAAEMLALETLLEETYPRHRYVVEPQATQYTTHGDLWDFIYDRHRAESPTGVYLPLTLELGASSWLRKSLRLLDKSAFFHPLAPHRTKRVLRRHVPLFEFLLRAAYSWEQWARLVPKERVTLTLRAHARWA